MTAWVYTIVRNEAALMPYFLRHYQSFCERVVVYDDHSDDDTAAIVQAAGAELRSYPGEGLDDIAFVTLANEQYKEARGHADWVIWVDGDEFLYHPRLTARLSQFTAEGVTAPLVDGFNMVAEAPPSGSGQIYDEIQTGFRDQRYSKPVIFNPDVDLAWTVGRHEVVVSGRVVSSNGDPLKLLHYRYLGRVYHEMRARRNWEHLSEANIVNNLGWEVRPGWQGAYSTGWYEQQKQAAAVCV